MAGANEMGSVEGQLVGLPLAGPESFSVEQLAYLKRALGVDETTLFTSSTTDGEGGDITLSEPITNFSKIEITYITMPTCCGAIVSCFDSASIAANNLFLNCTTLDGTTGGTLVFRNKRYAVNNNKDTFTVAVGSQVYYNGTNWSKSTNNSYVKVLKVIGIHRIAGGN